MVLLGVMLSVPCNARAGAGSGILETIGISIAVGAVLGASTLPFYGEPGKHLINVAYGASTGAVVGVGILVYGLFRGPQGDAPDGSDVIDDYYSSLKSGQQRHRTRFNVSGSQLRTELTAKTSPPLSSHRFQLQQPTSNTHYVWMPLVSLNW